MTFGRPKCRCNKAVYKDLAHAERVLERKQQLGQDPHMPTRAERCDQGQWHLVGSRALPTGPDRNTRDLVIVRDEGRCVRCGTPTTKDNYSLQHRVARGAGGTSDPVVNSPANLILLCGSATTFCHGEVEKRGDDDYAHGFWLHRIEAARVHEIPVMHAVHGWVRLTIDGGWKPVLSEEDLRVSLHAVAATVEPAESLEDLRARLNNTPREDTTP